MRVWRKFVRWVAMDIFGGTRKRYVPQKVEQKKAEDDRNVVSTVNHQYYPQTFPDDTLKFDWDKDA